MEAGVIALAFGGVIAANVLLATVSSWIRAIVEVRRTYQSHPWRMVVLTSLFNAGPWLMVAASVFVFYEHSAKWAPIVFGGAAAWLLFFGALMLVVYVRNRGKVRKSAPVRQPHELPTSK